MCPPRHYVTGAVLMEDAKSDSLISELKKKIEFQVYINTVEGI
jgi:hypothetical protein